MSLVPRAHRPHTALRVRIHEHAARAYTQPHTTRAAGQPCQLRRFRAHTATVYFNNTHATLARNRLRKAEKKERKKKSPSTDGRRGHNDPRSNNEKWCKTNASEMPNRRNKHRFWLILELTHNRRISPWTIRKRTLSNYPWGPDVWLVHFPMISLSTVASCVCMFFLYGVYVVIMSVVRSQ